jgi:hypothetical protein
MSVSLVNQSTDDQQPPGSYTPHGGWNPTFSQKDRITCTDLFEYIRPIHGEIIAEIMSQMIIYKQKYHLRYSEEQEQKIAAVFTKSYSLGKSISPKIVIKNKAV